MGLDAFVYCRCWQDGLATPPPVGPLGFDPEGYFSLLLPYDENEDAHYAFDVWLDAACQHQRMEQAHEHLSNWAGVRLFQQALHAMGRERLPTLHDCLPDANGGSMPADQAALALEELDRFRSMGRLRDDVVLIDQATGQVLMTYVAAYEGVLMLGPGYRAGVDPDGFFVRDPRTDPPATLFRAKRFNQRQLAEGEVEFTGDGITARVPMPLVGETLRPPPVQLAVVSRHVNADGFDYIVEPLRILCEASVSTGNPVMWT